MFSDLMIITKATGRKEGNALFNGTLNTFYLRLYGVGHMVKNHSEGNRKYSGTMEKHILL